MNKTSVTLVLEGIKYTLFPSGTVAIEDGEPTAWTKINETDRYRLIEAGLMRAQSPKRIPADYRLLIYQTLEDHQQADVYARLYQTLSKGQKKHVRARVTIRGTRYRLHDDASVTINGKDNIPWLLMEGSHRHALVYECITRAYYKEHPHSRNAPFLSDELAGYIENAVKDPDQYKVFEQVCGSFE
ncbi:MAG: hypothetical protein VX730_07105 [Pseudomonadota bacterium]|nr:hypothetical protein [Pseudomonadota bacterium]